MARPRADKPTYTLVLRSVPGKAGSAVQRYYVQWWEGGASRRVSCRTASAPAARRFLAEFQAAQAAPLAPSAPTVGEVMTGYEADRATKSHSPTLAYCCNHIRALLADLPCDLLTKERVSFYVAERRETGAGGAPSKHRKKKRPLSDATLRRELLTLRAALGWAVKERWITAIPPIELPATSEPRTRWLTREEATRLLASAKQLHVRVFIALALYTAGRAGALTELTWDRVDFTAKRIVLGAGSGNKRRATVPLVPALLPYLREAEAAKASRFVVEHGGERVGTVKTGFRRAAERAGLSGVTPHVLRHTAATWMAQRGVPLDQIAGFLGNSAATVEKVYRHHHPDFMADAVAAFEPITSSTGLENADGARPEK